MGNTTYLVKVDAPGSFKFYASRRYSEFDALHESLTLKFANIDWPEIPSKMIFWG